MSTTSSNLNEKKSILRKLNEHKLRKRRRFKDLESYRNELLIDKLRLMLYEPNEHLKRVSDRRDSKKSENKNTNLKSSKKWLKLEKFNSLRRNDFLLSKLNKREMSS